jgi:hypothetical protein
VTGDEKLPVRISLAQERIEEEGKGFPHDILVGIILDRAECGDYKDRTLHLFTNSIRL